MILYTQPAPIPDEASNQDRLTPDVWLTRATSKGLFNAYSETNAGTLSPANTEWALGTLEQYDSLAYTNWLAWLNGQSPVTLVGQPAVLHLISDDIYLSIEFTEWVPGGSGGFAYQRSTPSPALLSGGAVSDASAFVFNYSTSAGYSYVIQTSSNLVDWTPLATNVAAGDSLSYSNLFDPGGAQFFRVGRLLGP